MFQHQGAIFIGFIKNKESYIQHVLQVPVTLPVIKNLKILQLQLLTSTVHTAVITTYIDGPLVLFKSQLFIFSSLCIQTSLKYMIQCDLSCSGCISCHSTKCIPVVFVFDKHQLGSYIFW